MKRPPVNQPSLFDAPKRDTVPFAVGSPTSRAAAERVRPKRPSQRDRIENVLVDSSVTGMTRKEIAAALGLSENTVRPRTLELIEQGRAVELKDRVRDGCAVIVARRYA